VPENIAGSLIGASLGHIRGLYGFVIYRQIVARELRFVTRGKALESRSMCPKPWFVCATHNDLAATVITVAAKHEHRGSPHEHRGR
jgi:hypothetical protein